MIGKENRSYYVYDNMFKDVFHSDAFKDYTAMMINSLIVKEDMDPKKLGTLTEIVLQYVNGNLQNVDTTLNIIDNTVDRLSKI